MLANESTIEHKHCVDLCFLLLYVCVHYIMVCCIKPHNGLGIITLVCSRV